ncbi:MAG: SsrA-binding protein SmpB [Nitrospirae bacterium]|nr:SsrA-binding protein SmpB [Nitrospirota bacterium]MBF0540869.1 SsrA-binding protein SmpB [Nitrospirota bacterium]
MKIFAQNRKAYHEYFIEETLEAGMVLLGTEVKSIREGRVNLKEGYVLIKDGEVFLLGCHINPYSHGNITNHDPLRTRKCLLHAKEINKLTGRAKEKGYTLVPLKVYLKGQLIKLEIGLAKGKKQFEKREQIKEREVKREIEQQFKTRT